MINILPFPPHSSFRFSRVAQVTVRRRSQLQLMQLNQTFPLHLTCIKQVSTQRGKHVLSHIHWGEFIHFTLQFQTLYVWECMYSVCPASVMFKRGLVTHFCLSPLTHALIGYPLHSGQGLPLKKCPIIRKWEVTWAWFVLQGLSRHLNMKLNCLHLLSFFFLLMTTVHFCW